MMENPIGEPCSFPGEGKILLCSKHRKELNVKYAVFIPPEIRKNFVQKDSESFFFNPRDGGLFMLNTTGSFILRKLIEGKNFYEIVEEIESAFRTESVEELLRDCQEFIEEFKGVVNQ